MLEINKEKYNKLIEILNEDGEIKESINSAILDGFEEFDVPIDDIVIYDDHVEFEYDFTINQFANIDVTKSSNGHYKNIYTILGSEEIQYVQNENFQLSINGEKYDDIINFEDDEKTKVLNPTSWLIVKYEDIKFENKDIKKESFLCIYDPRTYIKNLENEGV